MPNIDLALVDLQGLIDVARLAERSLAQRSTGEVFARVLGLRFATEDELHYRTLSELLTPAGLAAIGVDVGGSAVIVPTVSDRSVIVGFDLVNRVRFESWLAQIAGGESKRTVIAGEQASVLEPGGELPITCLSRRTVAYCQLGAAAGADPIAPLRALVSFASPSLSTASGVVRAYRRLPEDAHAFAIVNGDVAARAAAQIALARAQRLHRFDPPETRRRAEHEAALLAQRIRRAGDMVEGVASGVYVGRAGIRVRAELAVGERGAKALRVLSADDGAPSTIARWSDTPALARLLVRMKGPHAERLLGAIGFPVEAGTLSGTFALLTLGVDSECPLAKHADQHDSLGWAFLLPSAVAVGLTGPTASSEARRAALRLFDPAATPPEGDDPIRGRAFGSTYEIRAFDHLLLAGTGPGAGAAALRRMNGLPPPPAKAAAGDGLPVVEGSLHLRAIDAALGAANFAREGRPELRMVDAIRSRVRPLLDQIEGVSVEIRTHELERRVRVDLAVQR